MSYTPNIGYTYGLDMWILGNKMLWLIILFIY